MSRLVIGLKGKKRSGKSTVANHLGDACGFARVRFAGPLKAMTAALGFNDGEIEGHLKEVPSPKLTHANFEILFNRIDDAFASVGVTEDDPFERVPLLGNRTLSFAAAGLIGTVAKVIADGELHGGGTPRRLMQAIGTDWGRDMIYPDLWIDLWQAGRDAVAEGKPVVAEDCRFANEAEVIKQTIPSLIIEIERDGLEAGDGHASEKMDFPADIIIKNNGTIDDLLRRVDDVLRDLSWSA